ncbi:MAG: hypothetical protein ABSD38_12980 [Syntrophorhabdales bacterium]|jgi:hypothetical protein
MKVTPRLKEKLERAKAAGYKHIYSVVGAYGSTTYCIFHDVDSVLAKPNGYDYGCGRPAPAPGMWTGHPNTRQVECTDIGYTALFAMF